MSMRTRLRTALASQEDLAAHEERDDAVRQGCQAVVDTANRRRAVLSGVIRSVVLRPEQGVAVVEAELYDGSGAVDLVWLGRRRIAGIEPGRRARVEGLVCEIEGRRRMYNPRYELRPRVGE